MCTYKACLGGRQKIALPTALSVLSLVEQMMLKQPTVLISSLWV